MKKILIIAYYFPPIQSSGVYRSLKFVKYLREFGWEPIVLTINPVCGHPKDEGLLRDVPDGVVIERMPQLDFRRLINFFKRQNVDKREDWRQRPEEVSGQDRGQQAKLSPTGTLSTIRRQMAVFVRNVFFVPDDEAPWIPIAVGRAVRLAKRERIDAVMTTSPPHSAHLVGLLTKLATGLPWIVDFRDLWTDTFDFYPKRFGQWRKPLERWMEKAVIRRADIIINISNGESRCLQSEHRDVPVDKFRVIHNGYDPEDFGVKIDASNSDIGRDKRRLRITYVGTLYSTTADTFFEALSTCVEANPRLQDDLELAFIGHIDSEYANIINGSNYRDLVRMAGLKPHAEAIRAMCNADVLLILHGGNKIKDSDIPGKIFEYMGAGKPILALARPGDIVSILSKTNLALVANPDDKDSIAQKLLELIESKKHGRLDPRPNYEYIGSFSRRNLTRKLSYLLDEIVIERSC